MDLCEKLKKVKLLLSDVDGVMNDGKIYYLPCGDRVEVAKFFNVKDGLGIRLWKLAGGSFGVISGRSDRVVEKRCKDLGCDFVLLGVKDKLKALKLVLENSGLKKEQIAYIGDDWNDVPLSGKVGLFFTLSDAPEEIRSRADFVIPKRGGEGVIRYTIEKILKCKGIYRQAVEKFLFHLKEEDSPT